MLKWRCPCHGCCLERVQIDQLGIQSPHWLSPHPMLRQVRVKDSWLRQEKEGRQGKARELERRHHHGVWGGRRENQKKCQALRHAPGQWQRTRRQRRWQRAAAVALWVGWREQGACWGCGAEESVAEISESWQTTHGNCMKSAFSDTTGIALPLPLAA